MKRTLLALLAAASVQVAHSQLPVMVQDINKAVLVPHASPRYMTNWNQYLYFSALDSAHGRELWRYNEKTPATLVYDHNTGTSTTIEGALVVFNNKLYYPAIISGRRTLCVYDGVSLPTEAPGFSAFTAVTQIAIAATPVNRIYFLAKTTSPGNNELFVYDGTSAPSKITLSLPPNPALGASPVGMAEFKGKFYFNAYSSTSTKGVMYSYDPANIMVSQVTTAGYAAGFPDAGWGYVSGDAMFFSASADTAGSEIYTFDGSNASRLTNTSPGVAASISSGPLMLYSGNLYYVAGPSTSNRTLMSCHPTTGGGTVIHTATPNADPNIDEMGVYNNKLYYPAWTAAKGKELWQYDGTTSQIVHDIYPATFSGVGLPFFGVYNGHLYFAANDPKFGNELFRLGVLSGIAHAGWEGKVAVYPNPAISVVKLVLNLPAAQQLSVSLTDVSGREVCESVLSTYAAGKNELSIPVQHLVAGQYFCRVADSGGNLLWSTSVIKQ
jgi:ELWxxDGT repeat protein